MGIDNKTIRISNQQQRALKLLFKFRFISTQLLANIMGIGRRSTYEVLEILVSKGYVDKVYEKDYRYAKKPAYYYLNKAGVTAVRKLLGVNESVVHALYKNDKVTDEFIERCLNVAAIYTALNPTLPKETQIFTRTEINRFTQFPKNRPDLYVRTPNGREAIVLVALDQPAYIIRKRLDEIISHSEDEGWDGDYPTICIVVKNKHAKDSLLYTTAKKLESMGMDDEDLRILIISYESFSNYTGKEWASVFQPNKPTSLFE